MVAKIVSGKSIRGLLNYNESKVKAGKAELIMVSRFAGETSQLGFNQKLQRFEHLTDLNSHVKTNSVHIMLNFDFMEQPDYFKLQQIAASYMEKIGFGEQPYLVYKHEDAAHPHIHIVTTNIQEDGSRINLHDIGKRLSEPARKELEKEFGLIKAEGKELKDAIAIKAVNIEKAEYGKTPTKRAITNVVTAVTRDYKYTSLAEMNAILKQFNVIADRGKEDTQMFQKKGLIYSIIDEKGNKMGIPFKASSLNGKPTLPNLESKFIQNEEKRKPYKEDLKASIDKVFTAYQQITKETFVKELANLNINALFRQNEQGLTYGVTFVDNKNKTVFNGSDLGKAYSAKAISERFSNQDKPVHQPQQTSKPLHLILSLNNRPVI
ncbi:relaxase/mobilization nuclease domain-containing protein [uncultured Mucilaginibacter sp.]|uniref:relaxase/mobilization nuclease domain-containing protein n=1 Tax=uncultured Mucilaginibacter sp. TaxID=797541 RepID=UPI0026052087|nr:relaxase/mobilization nuclease domain-containing protein [uncultured Mucilaginibacter sp.]